MKCAKCSTEMTALDSFRCASCGKMTCLAHRMPDRHDCYKDEIPGMEVKSLLAEKPQPAPAAAPRPNPLAGQRETSRIRGQAVERLDNQPQKKKRFGIF